MKLSIPKVPNVTLLAVMAALVLAAAMPATAAAGSAPIRFDVSLGSACVHGESGADKQINLVWKNASGAVKLQATTTSTDFGSWFYCSPNASTVLAIGDRLKASAGPSTHILNLPTLTAKVNRIDDVVRGKGPAGSMVKVFCWGGPLPTFEPCVWDARVRVSASGKWSVRPGWDVLGGESFGVRWKNAAGDKVWAQGTGPFVTVTLGSSRFSGATRPNQTAHLVIRDGTTLDVMAMGSAVSGPELGGFSGRFRDGEGQLVAISAGDVLSSDISADIDWIVPDIDATASAATDVVSGRCHDAGTSGGVVQIRLTRGGLDRGWADDGTEADGSFAIYMPDVFPDPANVKSGDKIVVACMQTNADWVQTSFIVP